MNLGIKQTGLLLGAAFVVLVGVMSLGKLVEFNDAGEYSVLQTVSGKLEVYTAPGPFFQAFGTVTKYPASEIFEMAKDSDEAPVNVRFSDGGTAKVSGSVQFILPSDEKSLLDIHQFFRTSEALKTRVLRQTFYESVQQTAALMKAEDSYATKRSQYAPLVEEQISRGLFDTEAVEVKEKDVDGNEFNDINITIKTDTKGKRVISKISPIIRYGIVLGQVTIKDFDYDDTIDALIQKKKEAEQQKVVSRSNAEKSKQDAITSREKAAADIAIAKGAEEVEKIKEITKAEKEKAVAILTAQKDFESAKLARQTAEENAAAEISKGQAEAKIAALKVNAGLSPQERAQFDVQKADVVSKNLASIKLPSMMIIGGDSKGSAADPFTAIGIESLMRINDKFSK